GPHLFFIEETMNKTLKLMLTTSIVGLLTACGGGGSGSKTVLSSTQQNFETTTLADYFASFDSNLPTNDVVPTPGTHYFSYESNSAPNSPSAGPVANTRTITSMSNKLTVPPEGKVERVLNNLKIYTRNDTSKQEWSYVGNDVLLTSYADDGKTKLYTAVYDEWSAPIPFTETIGTTAILKSFFAFSRLNTPLNFNFQNKWLVASSYFTRKGYQLADTLFVWDWPGEKPTNDANVSPYSGTESSIKKLFEANPNGIIQDNVVYKYDGDNGGKTTIIDDEIIAWVANKPRPTSIAPTEEYFVIFLWGGKIYQGVLRKAGARFKYIDGVDTIKINDYDIRLNSNAVESLKKTMKF
ncbi:MAG: hypothetical protein ORN54_01740, partial [Cyclobacteriaceae bacterium]|nr:hypothetical protein [Cyclobacteriaceae bacterium]